MVMVVADPILESRRRPGRLDAAEQASFNQDTESVIYRLERDGPDVGPDGIGYAFRRDVRPTGNGPHDGQSLGCDLDTALPEDVSRAGGHPARIVESLSDTKF